MRLLGHVTIGFVTSASKLLSSLVWVLPNVEAINKAIFNCLLLDKKPLNPIGKKIGKPVYQLI